MPRFDKNGKPEIKRSTGPYGINTIVKNGEKYMTRIWLGRLRMHIFYRGDEDRDPHDHPWSFWTFPFTPYVEEVTRKIAPPMAAEFASDQPKYVTTLEVVPAWKWNFRKAEHCHRVIGKWTGFYEVYNREGHLCGKVRDTDYGLNKYAEWGYHLSPEFEVLDGTKRMITLVVRTGFTRMWGFLKCRDGKWCWQDFRSYINEGGGSAPCE